MKTSKNFVSLGELNPEAAMHLLPSVKLQVSRRTFAQIAAAKFDTLKTQNQNIVVSSEPSINSEQSQIVHAAAMAATVCAKDE